MPVQQATVDPRTLFPALAIFFVLLALLQFWSTGRWRAAATTWAWIALCFSAVSWWLQRTG